MVLFKWTRSGGCFCSKQNRSQCVSEFSYFKKICKYFSSEGDFHKYQKTVLLPATSFPRRHVGQDRVAFEEEIQKISGFQNLYDWQRKQERYEEFVLHDGPPYANGKPHIGHAVNKVLKDIFLRFKLLQGYKVHFEPGWDCHGLPIELKAMGKTKVNRNDLQEVLNVRKEARNLSEKAIAEQQATFKRWGLLVDWNTAYTTSSAQYVAKELELFADLYEKGYIYQAYMPTYYSPSSGTSLAEAELEYRDDHVSPSLFLALPVLSVPQQIKDLLHSSSSPLYIPVWTTTPWTLPANMAVSYAEHHPYLVVDLVVQQRKMCLIWAEELRSQLDESGICNYSVVGRIQGSCMKGMTYCHPLGLQECPVVPSGHVTMTKGTGLVHMAPAHGREDFLVALQYKINTDVQLIDDDGCFLEEAGKDLAGKNVLVDASSAVIDILRDKNRCPVLHLGSITHSYPYDWRTKKPVIIRASKQWFFDVDKVKDAAVEFVKSLQMLPRQSSYSLIDRIRSRSYWCISRQRAWGVPIPVFYDKVTHDPVINKHTVCHIASVIRKHGVDSWWTLSEDQLLPQNVVEEYHRKGSPLPEKGLDILDIWFDSGSSWHCALDGRHADLYLEGHDQLTGWFQSSLLLSIASRGKSPYKQLFVHGFAVDENCKKMSKSVGNVVDPEMITDGKGSNTWKKVYGADNLRWWVADSTVETNIAVGPSVMEKCSKATDKIRNTFWFLLSSLDGFRPQEHTLSYSDLRPLDKYILHLLHDYCHGVMESYNQGVFNEVVSKAYDYFHDSLSAFYLACIKDRLYCESLCSVKRTSAQTVMYYVVHHTMFSIAPIIPHLAEEVGRYFSCKGVRGPVFKQVWTLPPSSWHQPHLAASMELCLDVKTKLKSKLQASNSQKYDVSITAARDYRAALKVLQSSHESQNSGLCELLQVAKVTLVESEDAAEMCSLNVVQSEGTRCLRCRRWCATEGEDLCIRCKDVVLSLKYSSVK